MLCQAMLQVIILNGTNALIRDGAIPITNIEDIT